MPEWRFELGQIVRRNGRGNWGITSGVVTARATTEHWGLGSRPEYYVAWTDGGRAWHCEVELSEIPPEPPRMEET